MEPEVEEPVVYIADDEDDEDLDTLARAPSESPAAALEALGDPAKAAAARAVARAEAATEAARAVAARAAARAKAADLQTHVCLVLLCTLVLLFALIAVAWRQFGRRILRARGEGARRVGDKEPRLEFRHALKKVA